MHSDEASKDFHRFILQAIILLLSFALVVVGVNYSVDASSVITARSHKKMAQIALSGQTVKTPENYNERVYQVSIVDQMEAMPETVVIGSSRGMYLGEQITGFDNIYNNCVSGGCIEDYFGLLGLYYEKFNGLPSRVIIELSPWVLYKDNPEARWVENRKYRESCENLYKIVMGYDLKRESIEKENPFFSIPYFQYNCETIGKKGMQAFGGEKAEISENEADAADLSDGTIRYAKSLEESNEYRTKKVKSQTGAVTYEDVDKMVEIDEMRKEEFESLIEYMLQSGTEMTFYVQPFSDTQCKYIYDINTNQIFSDVEDYLKKLASSKSIDIKGSYDSRKYGLDDTYFIDFMHLDKRGVNIVWHWQ